MTMNIPNWKICFFEGFFKMIPEIFRWFVVDSATFRKLERLEPVWIHKIMVDSWYCRGGVGWSWVEITGLWDTFANGFCLNHTWFVMQSWSLWWFLDDWNYSPPWMVVTQHAVILVHIIHLEYHTFGEHLVPVHPKLQLSPFGVFVAYELRIHPALGHNRSNFRFKPGEALILILIKNITKLVKSLVSVWVFNNQAAVHLH